VISTRYRDPRQLAEALRADTTTPAEDRICHQLFELSRVVHVKHRLLRQGLFSLSTAAICMLSAVLLNS
jgi:hypothetical protein